MKTVQSKQVPILAAEGMTVGDLIRELQELDDSLPVVGSTGDEYSNLLRSGDCVVETVTVDGQTVEALVLQFQGDLAKRAVASSKPIQADGRNNMEVVNDVYEKLRKQNIKPKQGMDGVVHVDMPDVAALMMKTLGYNSVPNRNTGKFWMFDDKMGAGQVEVSLERDHLAIGKV